MIEALLLLIIVCQFIDIWSTYQVLKLGGRELNPIIDAIISSLGVLPGLIISKGIFIGFIIYYYRNLTAATSMDYLIVIVLTIIYIYIVRNNIIVLKSLKQNQ